ncbi:MAG: flavocytochrome c [Clostridia bacterium]
MKRYLAWVLVLALALSLGAYTATAEEMKTIETDVVVVGGGGAGIATAIAAAQQGAKVTLIEKVGYLGGATLMSGGLIPAVGTKQQIEAGIDDNIEWFVRDIMRPSNYSVREDLVRTVAEQAKPTVEWMEQLGVKFSVVTSSLYYGQSNYRMHLAEGSGHGLTTALVESLNKLGNVTVMLETPGTGLATNEAGEVIGVYAENKTDGKLLIKARNTVLATSGFGANAEMVEKYMPEIAAAYKMVAPGATGEGIQWGMDLGAAVANMGAYQGHAFYCEGYGSTDQSIITRGGIFVNKEGVRFCNEYGGYSELSPHVLAQPDHHAYMVFDDQNAQNTKKFAEFSEKGIVLSANTPEELAQLMGVDAEKLTQTFDQYRASIERGEDEFNRTKLPASFEGPYHAILITADLRHTQGGLVTDTKAHVLREDGTPIKGLLAAGGVTEGFSSKGGAAYMSGNGLLQALIFGKIAGETAAAE